MPEPEPQQELESLEPGSPGQRALRKRLTLKGEFALAILPTATVLAVLGLVHALTEQRLLFASLSSSAFLIYLDPQHGTNSVRTLVLSQILAAVVGVAMYTGFGPGYLSGGAAMVATITLMILLDAVHPPAVATAMSFALRAGETGNVVLFGFAVMITGTLVLLERAALWILARYARG